MEKLENFIPVSIKKLQQDLLKNHQEKDKLSELFKLLIAFYQYNTNKKFNHLKELYQEFNPDLDILIDDYSDKNNGQKELQDGIDTILSKANYQKLSLEEIQKSINTQPNSGLNIEVDTNEYDVFDIYYRGNTSKDIIQKHLLNPLIKPKKIKIDIYTRLFIIAKLKNKNQRIIEISEIENITLKKAEKRLNKIYKKLPDEINSEKIFLKVFKDIPHLDLEMLFFIQNIRLKLLDKLRLIITSSISTTTGVFAIIGKLAIALNPVAIIGAFAGLVGLVVKQISNFFNQHRKYQNILTQNLYFKNLNNNLGAINFISNNSFEEEIKELILGYFFILENNNSLNEKQLDDKVEGFLLEKYNLKLDFEVDDSLSKLKSLDLLTQKNTLIVNDLDTAIAKINKKWQTILK